MNQREYESSEAWVLALGIQSLNHLREDFVRDQTLAKVI